ncbi:cytochrome P450 [Aspergillus cavernicola]|uniref:Cytochrome P450 n=1 Tax=Aspergillus cavernicola TaxID=176166 RepID=A0ABR4IE24_9EURO
MSVISAIAIFLLLLAYIVSKFSVDAASLKMPAVTSSRFFPDFVNRLLFFVQGPALIHEGYRKYKDVPFRILKVDADLIVLPARYLPEIRQFSHNTLSLLDAQFDSVCGEFTNILNDSYLPAHTVTKKLTPALNRIVPNVIDELKHAFPLEVPECNDRWVPVNLYYMILKLINRSTSRIIVGDALCRSELWLDTVVSYTHNLGITIIILRPLPKFVRPFVAKLLPSVRHLNKTLKWVKEEVFIPIIVERRAAEATDPKYRKPDDFMQWMMETADNEYDKEPENIAQGLLIIMALAVVHTSTMLITQGLYDLLIRPELVDPLRHEIIETLKDGWANATVSSFSSQRLMDSFLRESQRLTPTGEVNVQRIAKETIIFSDGFIIPKGTHICFASGPLSRDPNVIPDPETFDAYRWCKDPKARSTSLVSISEANLHFGYGRQACPGRFFSAHTSKAILSHLLVEYDIRLEEGKEGKRPMNIRNGEQIMPNFYTKVLLRKRGVNI